MTLSSERLELFKKYTFNEQLTNAILENLRQWCSAENSFMLNDEVFWHHVLKSHFPFQFKINLSNPQEIFLIELNKYFGYQKVESEILTTLSALRGECDETDLMSCTIAVTNGHFRFINTLSPANCFTVLAHTATPPTLHLFQELLNNDNLKNYAAKHDNQLLKNAVAKQEWEICMVLLENNLVMQESIARFDDYKKMMPDEYQNIYHQLLINYLKSVPNSKNDFLCIQKAIEIKANQEEIIQLINTYIKNYGIEASTAMYNNARIQGETLLDFCYREKHLDIAIALLEILPKKTMREYIRKISALYFSDPSASLTFSPLLAALKKHVKPDQSKGYNLAQNSQLQAEYLRLRQELFGNDLPKKIASSFDEGINNVLYQLTEIFDNPDNCKKYLLDIDQGIAQCYREAYGEELPQVDPKLYEYHVFNYYNDDYDQNMNGCFHYPVPKNENYAGIKKHNAVERYLLGILKQHGIAEKQYKLIGFIPERIANTIFANGSFLIEQSLGISELTHGKMAHMLQHAILAIALKDLYHEYLDSDGQIKQFTLSEIINETVKLGLWTTTRDNGARNASFNSPFSLFTYIMNNTNEMKTLSNCMIDSFCKGLMRCFAAYKKTNPLVYTSFDEFIFHLKDLELLLILDYPPLTQLSIECEKEKGRNVYAMGTGYAVTEKNYTPLQSVRKESKQNTPPIKHEEKSIDYNDDLQPIKKNSLKATLK